jgi:glucose-6-phosphate 1-dehydrogenase
LEPPAQRLFAASASTTGRANYLRFQVSPVSAIALAARVNRAGNEFVGDQRELYLLEQHPDEETPYALLLGDAMAGDGAPSAARMRLKPPGRRSIPFLRNTTRIALTIAAVGARTRLT